MKYLASNNRLEKNKCSLVSFTKYKTLSTICLLATSSCLSVDNHVTLWEYRTVAQAYIPINAMMKTKLKNNCKLYRYISLLQSEDYRRKWFRVNLAIRQTRQFVLDRRKAICIFDIDPLIIKLSVSGTLIRLEIDANKLVTAGVNELRHDLKPYHRSERVVEYSDAMRLS